MRQLALCAAGETCRALPLPTMTPPPIDTHPSDTRAPRSPTTHRALLSAALDTKDLEASLALLMARYKGTTAATGDASKSRVRGGTHVAGCFFLQSIFGLNRSSCSKAMFLRDFVAVVRVVSS